MTEEKRAALTPEKRRRLLHMGPTVPIEIDVARAFGDEVPTAPGTPSREVLAELGADQGVQETRMPAFWRRLRPAALVRPALSPGSRTPGHQRTKVCHE